MKLDGKSLGRCGENHAALYLLEKGYRIIGRNVRVGHAEIDIIAENDEYIVFAEVKTRRSDSFGTPASAVDGRKSELLIKAAEGYMEGMPPLSPMPSATPLSPEGVKVPRIDVIEVYADEYSDGYKVISINHIENAVRKKSKFSRRR